MKLIRNRPGEKQTLGIMVVPGFDCKTLELPWINNQQEISCIPVGSYICKKRWSEKYGHHFIVEGVPGRSYILIHFGNYYTNTKGCILVGLAFTDINNDGLLDVTSSKNTMKQLYDLQPDEFVLEVMNAA